MKLYTIGFTKKTAQEFFEALKINNIKKVIDIRLNNSSQLAGFAKGKDLKYFLNTICNIDYEHNLNLAPTKELLTDYKNKTITWDEYEKSFLKLLSSREINHLNYLDNKNTCLLCSEASAQKCHRRLVAEYLCGNSNEPNIEVVHL